MDTARVSGFLRDYTFGGILRKDFEKLLENYWVDKHKEIDKALAEAQEVKKTAEE